MRTRFSEPPASRRWAKSLTALLAVLFALVVGEIVVRIGGAAPRIKSLGLDAAESVYRRSENPILGYELKPGYHATTDALRRSHPSTNLHGQRDIERTIEKPPGVERIILLGDSVVEGHDLPELDDTISRRLERLYPPGTTEALNFGVSGYCTLAEIELFEVKGLQFDPDRVVLFFVANDFDNFNREASRLGRGFERPRWVERLFRLSHGFRLVALGLDLFRYRAELDPVGWNDEAIGDNNVVVGLERLADLARRHGFEPIVVVWPEFHDERIVDPHALEDGSGRLVIERLAASRGIPSFRLSEFFERDRKMRAEPTNPRLLYTVGDALHPSPVGAEVAARALRELLSRPSVPPPPVSDDDGLAVERARTLGAGRPTYARVHNNLGLELKLGGETDRAAEQFRLALAVDPGLADAHNNLANILLEQGQLDEAIVHYREAAEIDPLRDEVHFNLALALERTNENEAAIERLRQTLRVRPTHAGAQRKLGDLLSSRGDVETAIVHYRSAVALEPDSALLHANLGSLLAQRDRLDEAIVEFRLALEIRPDYELARRHLEQALALKRSGP